MTVWLHIVRKNRRPSSTFFINKLYELNKICPKQYTQMGLSSFKLGIVFVLGSTQCCRNDWLIMLCWTRQSTSTCLVVHLLLSLDLSITCWQKWSYRRTTCEFWWVKSFFFLFSFSLRQKKEKNILLLYFVKTTSRIPHFPSVNDCYTFPLVELSAPHSGVNFCDAVAYQPIKSEPFLPHRFLALPWAMPGIQFPSLCCIYK